MANTDFLGIELPEPKWREENVLKILELGLEAARGNLDPTALDCPECFAYKGSGIHWDSCARRGEIHYGWVSPDDYAEAKRRARQQENAEAYAREVAEATGLPVTMHGSGKTFESQKSESAVDHPSHYNQGAVEVIDLVEHLSFNAGNVIKYVARAPYKGKEVEDLEKALWYLRREIDRIKGASD